MARKSSAKAYFAASRTLAASYVFVAPLFGLYQLGILFEPGARSGTDPIYQELLHRFHRLGHVIVNLVLLGLLFLAIARTRKERTRISGLYALMWVESCLWAALMLVAAHLVPFEALAIGPFARDLVSGAGAGIYEETLFRFLLMGGLILVLHRGLGGRPTWVVPLAIATSAFLFSWAHHTIGREPWSTQVFLFRAAMGVILGWIYWVRGLGITIYTHALYNVVLVLERNV